MSDHRFYAILTLICILGFFASAAAIRIWGATP